VKLNLKDIAKYLFPVKRLFKNFQKIKSLDQLKNFIQEQSSQVTQMTLYGYLKTRMGAKHVLMFEEEEYLKSINLAKWNIYSIALIDCVFYCSSFLYNTKKLKNIEISKKIFYEIIEIERGNGMSQKICEEAKKEFDIRYNEINWTSHFSDNPFKNSSTALYDWAPVADELKKLDKQIVINSMMLKWHNVQLDFKKKTDEFEEV
tara:strand:- start:13232 stop:13843 length:612 start_codon:yes stop_codon:yes gene_type:complete